MRLNDGRDEAGKAPINLLATGTVLHFDSAPLSPDQAGLAQGFEVLGEGGLGDGFVAHLQKVRATMGALGSGDPGEDIHPHGVGEGVENAFDGDILDRRMKKGAHGFLRYARLTFVQ
jgi:hypothetical protein